MTTLTPQFDAVAAAGAALIEAMAAYTASLQNLAEAASHATLTDDDRAALKHAPVFVAETTRATEMKMAARLCAAWADHT